MGHLGNFVRYLIIYKLCHKGSKDINKFSIFKIKNIKQSIF
jgi:hypothetical protein